MAEFETVELDVEPIELVRVRFVLADPYEPSVEELAADRRRQKWSRAHCPGCGAFCRPEKVVFISRGGMGVRRVAEGVCARCGEYDIPLD